MISLAELKLNIYDHNYVQDNHYKHEIPLIIHYHFLFFNDQVFQFGLETRYGKERTVEKVGYR